MSDTFPTLDGDVDPVAGLNQAQEGYLAGELGLEVLEVRHGYLRSQVKVARRHMANNGYRFGALVEAIVLSPQFLNRRAPEAAPLQKADLQPAVKFVKTAFEKGN